MFVITPKLPCQPTKCLLIPICKHTDVLKCNEIGIKLWSLLNSNDAVKYHMYKNQIREAFPKAILIKFDYIEDGKNEVTTIAM